MKQRDKALSELDRKIQEIAQCGNRALAVAAITILALVAWNTRPAAHFWERVYATEEAQRQCRILLDLHPDKSFHDFRPCLPPKN